MRQRQIATATVIGALLAAACLLWEQQSLAALMINGKVDARATHPTSSPFNRRLKYSNV